jgi:hypothetical protein
MSIFQLRPEHLKAISEEDFTIRVAIFLRDTFPDAEDVARDELVRTVGEQVHRAMRYGFSAEQDIATYVITAWLLGEDFDTEFPAAGQILTSTDGAEARAAALEEWTKILFAALEEEGS